MNIMTSRTRFARIVAPLVAEIAALNYVIDKERVESSAKIVALKTENERLKQDLAITYTRLDTVAKLRKERDDLLTENNQFKEIHYAKYNKLKHDCAEWQRKYSIEHRALELACTTVKSECVLFDTPEEIANEYRQQAKCDAIYIGRKYGVSQGMKAEIKIARLLELEERDEHWTN